MANKNAFHKGKSYPSYNKGWFSPRRSGFRAACCDCGLVHIFKFRLVDNPRGHGKKIEMWADRDNRATAQIRRFRHGWKKLKGAIERYALIWSGR